MSGLVFKKGTNLNGRLFVTRISLYFNTNIEGSEAQLKKPLVGIFLGKIKRHPSYLDFLYIKCFIHNKIYYFIFEDSEVKKVKNWIDLKEV